MPFVSHKQRAWMFANKPKMARRWAKHTPKGANLPERVHSKTAEAFADELDKIGVRIGKMMPKVPVVKSMRRGVAKALRWLRSRGESGKALARVAQDPEWAPLLIAAPIYIGGQLVPFPMFGTTAGAAALLALQAPRIGRLRKSYKARAARDLILQGFRKPGVQLARA